MVEINEMILKLPGMNENDARYIGESVANRMADMLPDDAVNRQIDGLNIKLTVSQGASKDEMVERIATQILRQLKYM